MIYFIDLKNGNVFNGDAPYVHWFSGGQSTNLNYVRQICILSDRKYLNAQISSPVFSLLNLTNEQLRRPKSEINDFSYYNLPDFKVETYNSIGVVYEQYFIHMLYVLGSSPDAGQYTDSLYIGDTEYLIGADFYAENELLRANLQNFESVVPESIQRAVYDVNVHEESNDNIILNRKNKELLLNYWNTLANKGSYESLINSLKWFEWADLVHIEEYWRQVDPHGTTLMDRDLTTVLDQETLTQLVNNSKTTYIGLYFAMQKFLTDGTVIQYDDYDHHYGDIYVGDNQGMYSARLSSSDYYPKSITYDPYKEANYEKWYEDRADDEFANILQVAGSESANVIGGQDVGNEALTEAAWTNYYNSYKNEIYGEQNPTLEHVAAKWTYQDISLKMTLLGNFYQTYFMPIHLDLIHATIEHWVFTNTIKVLNDSEFSRRDYFDSISTFKADIESDYLIHPQSDTYYTNPDIMFATLTIGETGIRGDRVFGVSPDKQYDQISAQRVYNNQNQLMTEFSTRSAIYSRPCCIVKFKVQIPDDGDIKYAKLYDHIADKADNIYYKQESYNYVAGTGSQIEFEFYLAFEEEGLHQLNLSFSSTSGHVYSRHFELNIADSASQRLDLYYIKRLSAKEISNLDCKSVAQLEQINQLWSQSNKYTPHVQYIERMGSRGIGLNRIVMIDLTYHAANRLAISYNNQLYNISANRLPAIDNWIWTIQQRTVMINPLAYTISGSVEQHRVLVGINLEFDRDVDVYVDGRILQETDISRITNELRFIPCFHKLEPYDGEDITKYDHLCVVPNFKYNIPISKCSWNFINFSYDKNHKSYLTEFNTDYYSNNFNEPVGDKSTQIAGGSYTSIVAPYEPVELLPGYYDIHLTYMMNKQEQVISRKSAFRVIR